MRFGLNAGTDCKVRLIDAIDGILENSDVEFDGADFKANVVGLNRSDEITGKNENDLIAFTLPDIVLEEVAQEEIVGIWLAITDLVSTWIV